MACVAAAHRSFLKQRHSEIAQNFGGIRQHDIVEHDDRYWNQTPKVDFLPLLSLNLFFLRVSRRGIFSGDNVGNDEKTSGISNCIPFSLSLSRLFPPPVRSSLIVTMFDTSLAGSDEQKDTTGKEMYKIKIKGETQEGTTPASGTWKRWVYNKCTSGSAAAGIG